MIEHMFANSERQASSIVEALNDEQVMAVTHRGGPLLVLAGAGTGKTTTLSGRVGWLVEQGVPPERVLLLTFTRRAAREMLRRFPKAAYQTEIESWRVLPGDRIEFTVRRLPSAD